MIKHKKDFLNGYFAPLLALILIIGIVLKLFRWINTSAL